MRADILAIETESKSKRGVVCFAFFTSKDWLPYYEAFSEFFDHLQDDGYQLLVVGPERDVETPVRHSVYRIARNEIQTLEFVDVFLTLDWNAYAIEFPRTSKVVAFPHIFSDAETEQQIKSCAGFYGADTIDYHFITPPLQGDLDQLRNLAASEGSRHFPSGLLQKPACIIPGGYPKLDRYISHCRSKEHGADALLFAVTSISNGDRTLPDHGEAIIESLLDNFPTRKVIFRPTPRDRKNPIVQRLVDRFEDISNFELDVGQDIKETYARSKLMVCDQTNARSTFACATLRPFLRCCFDSKPEDRASPPLGRHLYDVSKLPEMIREMLNDESSHQQRIQHHLNGLIANQGRSLNYLAENMHFIASGQEHPDWLYYEKETSSTPVAPQDYLPYIERFMNRSTHYSHWAALVCRHALRDNPDNVALMATYARLLFATSNDQAARNVRDQALSLDPSRASAYLWANPDHSESRGIKAQTLSLLRLLWSRFIFECRSRLRRNNLKA